MVDGPWTRRRRRGGGEGGGCRRQSQGRGHRRRTSARPSQSTNFSVNGNSVIRAVPPLTPEEEKADEAARADWQARCRPTVIEDRDGLRRTKYAEPDCDLSRFNTAGK